MAIISLNLADSGAKGEFLSMVSLKRRIAVGMNKREWNSVQLIVNTPQVTRGGGLMNPGSRLFGAVLACFGAVVGAEPLSPSIEEQQFLSALNTRQQQNQRSIQQNSREIAYLESRIEAKEAEGARKQKELVELQTQPQPNPADKLQRNEAQLSAQQALDHAMAERAQLNAELDRRLSQQEQLVQEKKILQRLESEYEAEPQLGKELLNDLR